MTKLLAQIHFVVSSLPPSLLENLIDILLNDASIFNQSLKNRIISKISIPKFRRSVAKLLDLWATEHSDWNSSSLATALMSSAYSVNQSHKEVDVELVWTGPEVTEIPLRRTDRVLLQLIQEAKIELTLISFAVYKIPEIARVLLEALNRGVKVKLIAENPEVSKKIPFGIKEAFGKEIIEQSQVFIWSKDKRPVDNEGRYGSLHIKSAIADSHKLFITSANLTQYAFTLNMEMGVLIKSHHLANQVERQIKDLIENDILTLI
jgi:phosphatidylserine/phosphatidylglycerophosphate/cardiolipin synthase-like enzyme